MSLRYEKGPKFAVEPKLPPPAKLSMVRAMADRALPQERERFISDGVDVLCRTAGHRPKSLKMGAAVEHFKNNSVKLLTSDKEGGFVVLPHDLYAAKAREAVAKNFKVVKPGSLNKAKLRAKALCSEMDLSVLATKVNASKKLSLEIFFAAKTHKKDVPFRVFEAGFKPHVRRLPGL